MKMNDENIRDGEYILLSPPFSVGELVETNTFYMRTVEGAVHMQGMVVDTRESGVRGGIPEYRIKVEPIDGSPMWFDPMYLCRISKIINYEGMMTNETEGKDCNGQGK